MQFMRNAIYVKCIWKGARENFHEVKLLLRHRENVSTRLIIVVRCQFVTGRCYFLVIFISFENKLKKLKSLNKEEQNRNNSSKQTTTKQIKCGIKNISFNDAENNWYDLFRLHKHIEIWMQIY
mgnify:CR=1 FL=1